MIYVLFLSRQSLNSSLYPDLSLQHAKQCTPNEKLIQVFMLFNDAVEKLQVLNHPRFS